MGRPFVDTAKPMRVVCGAAYCQATAAVRLRNRDLAVGIAMDADAVQELRRGGFASLCRDCADTVTGANKLFRRL